MKKIYLLLAPFFIIFSIYSFGVMGDDGRRKAIANECTTREFPILMYHHIRAYEEIEKLGARNLSVSPEEFELQLRHFSEKGWKTITTSDILGNQVDCNAFMITFDDGYHDVYKHALPLMNKYGYTGIVSIIPAYIDESDYLSGKQIRDLQENEWELSSHTWHHPFLTKIPPEQGDIEIRKSKSDIEKWFGEKINTFVYPGGFYNEKILEQVKKAGYRYGMGTQFGYANLGTENLELRRINIVPGTTPEILEKMLEELRIKQ